VARDLKTATGRTVTTEAAVGHPARELVRIARERGAGLVVVGSPGHRPIERFLLGSVSEKVLRHADCSVLVVRTRPAAETVPVVTGQAVPVPA
jgi:nucleotide-binding universal stress UspA family protein